MKNLFKALLALGILLSSNVNKSNAETFRKYEAKVNGITYSVDPRIELFNTVAMLFGHNGMTLSNISYKQETLTYFAPYKQHPVVDSLLNTFKRGWGVDDPIFFMLCLDNKFDLKPWLSSGLIERGGGIDRLKRLAFLFKDFAKKSKFYTYFNEIQQQFYLQVVANTKYNFKDFNAVLLLENYYGEKANDYNFILNLLGGYGNFGRPITTNAKNSLYAVIETNSAIANVPVFQPSISIVNLIIHEFSHSFINPYIDQFSDKLKQVDSLYQPIEKSMKSQGYWQWGATVNEHVVRAVVTRITSGIYGNAFAYTNFYKPEFGKRFIYIDAIIAELVYYEKHREEYPTFKSFVPVLITAFDPINKDTIQRLQEKVEEFRKPNVDKIPKPNDFDHDSTTYFIMGTHEANKDAQASLKSFVFKYRNMISPSSVIITDEEALKMPLNNSDLIIFGTPEGNTFLKKYIDRLPVKILKDRVLTDKILMGDDYQVVTSWVSPFNEKKTMVIYTAQKTENIKNYDYSPVKDQYHYWVAKNTITIDKGDYGKYWQMWMFSL
ncbi:MAG: DUF4932 domain-containing protein [Bacteroidota bacterium]